MYVFSTYRGGICLKNIAKLAAHILNNGILLHKLTMKYLQLRECLLYLLYGLLSCSNSRLTNLVLNDFLLCNYKLSTNRSEEHTSELQSHLNLVCRLLLE